MIISLLNTQIKLESVCNSAVTNQRFDKPKEL